MHITKVNTNILLIFKNVRENNKFQFVLNIEITQFCQIFLAFNYIVDGVYQTDCNINDLFCSYLIYLIIEPICIC